MSHTAPSGGLDASPRPSAPQVPSGPPARNASPLVCLRGTPHPWSACAERLTPGLPARNASPLVCLRG
ncbi:hypothetical protein ACFC09_40370, partial [Streptomyces sp. NPDC056161]|uniref:hypothetical protein n=1 Tax=Streptomyces sp. NPDC056161 TaxID=3345732 RepID=UPI0035E0B8AE